MTAREILELMDQGKVKEAKSRISSAKDLIDGADPQEPADTWNGMLERINSTKAMNDYQREELRVRFETEAKQEDVSAQANEVQKQAAIQRVMQQFAVQS